MILLDTTMNSLEHIIRSNPHYGLIATFIISFIESLAIIGSVVPGSVTMSIIGSMIGAALLPLLPTLTMAFVGSYTGDIISFFIGKKCEPWVKSLQWIKNHKKWVYKAEFFIEKYGIISIIVGRFFGPMRSMVPMIAGALKMHNIKFMLAAIPSAALWSIVYLIPGIIIGMFSNELNLFSQQNIIIFISTIVLICVITFIFPRLKAKYNLILCNMHRKSLTKLSLTSFDNVITGLIFLILFLCVAYFFKDSSSKYGFYYFFQSLQTPSINYLMTVATMLADKYTFAALIFLLVIFSDKKEAKFIIISSCICLFLTLACKFAFHVHRPPKITDWNSFPSGHSIRAGFILNYFYLRVFNQNQQLKPLFWFLILMVAISRLYIGAHWWPDVVAGVSLGTGIIYITNGISLSCNPKAKLHVLFVILALISFIAIVNIRVNNGYYDFFFKNKIINISKNQWLNNNYAPIYIKNRFNKPIEPININWIGHKKNIIKELNSSGWTCNQWPGSWLDRLNSISKTSNLKFLPALPKLVNNKPPVIIATKNYNSKLIVITLWPSDINVASDRLYIGNVSEYALFKHKHHTVYHQIGFINSQKILDVKNISYSQLVIPPNELLFSNKLKLAKIY